MSNNQILTCFDHDPASQHNEYQAVVVGVLISLDLDTKKISKLLGGVS